MSGVDLEEQQLQMKRAGTSPAAAFPFKPPHTKSAGPYYMPEKKGVKLR
jgi:hypothetical protein